MLKRKFRIEKRTIIRERNVFGDVIETENKFYIYYRTWYGAKRYLDIHTPYLAGKEFSVKDIVRRYVRISKNNICVSNFTEEEAKYVVEDLYINANYYILSEI